MSSTPSASSKKQTNGTATSAASTPYVNGNQHLMDRAPEYSQSDQASAVQYQTASATPNSEYNLNPTSARQDPNITAATSPGYPPAGAHYSPYPPQGQDMGTYQTHPMYSRTGWPSPYQDGQGHGIPGQYVAQPSPTTTVSSASSAAPALRHGHPGGPPQGQVNYSFVPIPGSQQHKRPRRRYEEIERMYKCGHNGCEKAYGTLNHLNAHVTMQGHGTKRTPEEFKEIRKEWKQRKKEEEQARKAEEERQRNAAAQGHLEHPGPGDPQGQAPPNYSTPSRNGPQLPPLGFNQQPYPTTQGQGPYAPPAMSADARFNPYPNYAPNPYESPNPVYQQHPDVPPGNYQT